MISVREPNGADAERIIDYSKIVMASSDQLMTTLEEYKLTIDGQTLWIDSMNQDPNSKLLIAEINHEIIGLLFFNQIGKKRRFHTGEFGVSVHPRYKRLGIAKTLIKRLLFWANANAKIEKVFLNVLETNRYAIKLYTRLGFKEEGRFIKAVKQANGSYVDMIQMYIETNN